MREDGIEEEQVMHVEWHMAMSWLWHGHRGQVGVGAEGGTDAKGDARVSGKAVGSKGVRMVGLVHKFS